VNRRSSRARVGAGASSSPAQFGRHGKLCGVDHIPAMRPAGRSSISSRQYRPSTGRRCHLRRPRRHWQPGKPPGTPARTQSSDAERGGVVLHVPARPGRSGEHSDRAASAHRGSTALPDDPGTRMSRQSRGSGDTGAGQPRTGIAQSGPRRPYPIQTSTPTTTTATSEAPPQISHARVASCRH